MGAEQADGRRRHAAARAFAAEGGDGARMGEEEARLLPHFGQKLVEIVWRRRALARLDPLRRRGARQQAVFGVVDQLAFLALLHPFDQQSKLFLNLVERLAVEVGDARLHVENGGDRLEKIFARVLFVIDEGLRQVGLRSRGGLHSTSAVGTSFSLTRLRRKMPASTGVQARKLTSQRGEIPPHCARVLVALASWRAAPSLSVLRVSTSSAMPVVPFAIQFLVLVRSTERREVARADRIKRRQFKSRPLRRTSRGGPWPVSRGCRAGRHG